MSDISRWSAEITAISPDRVIGLSISADSKPLSFRDVCTLWRHDPDFARFFSVNLADMPFAAFFWEMPPLTTSNFDEAFQCVVVDSPQLAGVTADASPFGVQLDPARTADGIACFGNLGGDAWLIAPCAGADLPACAHLAEFVRQVPQDLQAALWLRVGESLAARVGPEPVWLSTSGLGVYWLHVRLDRQPKYYTHAPYRQAV